MNQFTSFSAIHDPLGRNFRQYFNFSISWNKMKMSEKDKSRRIRHASMVQFFITRAGGGSNVPLPFLALLLISSLLFLPVKFPAVRKYSYHQGSLHMIRVYIKSQSYKA